MTNAAANAYMPPGPPGTELSPPPLRGQGAEPAAGVANADHMSGGQRILALIVMTVGMFLALLDIQIVASSIAEIQAGLAATSEEISLVQTSYLIAEVIMIPLSGWLSRMLSTRWLFMVASTGFALASVGCAFAWNIESMVIFRALQGFLGGAMIPTVFATGYVLFPGEKAAKVPAILGLVATLSPVLGPTVGGWITDSASWRWLFLINVVPGILIAVIVPKILKIDAPDFALAKKFDLPGAVLLALFLGCLQYVLDEGPRKGWTEDQWISALILVSSLSAVLFIARSLLYREPVVDLRAFGNRNFTLGCALSFIFGIGLYGSIYLTPVFLAQIRGYSALQIGTTVFVVGISTVIATPITVLLLQRINMKLVLMTGFALFGLSCLLFSQIESSWGSDQILIPQILRGAAGMMCIIPVTTLALGGLAPDQIKSASGLFNLMRNLGGAIGLALINSSLFYDRLVLHYDRLLEGVNAGSANSARRLEALSQVLESRLTGADQSDLASVKLFATLVKREALTLSFADCYLLIMAFFLIALILIPFVKFSAVQSGEKGDSPSAH